MLSACLEGGTPSALAARPDVVALQRASIAGGAVVVDPPPGYCIDSASLNTRPSESFALLAACASLTGRVIGLDVEPALITVTAVPLPRGARSVTDAPVIQRVALRGPGIAAPSGDPRHWRGALRVGDRLVGLALYAAPGSPMAGPAGERLLAEVAQRIRDRSAARPARPVDRTTPAVAEDADSNG